MWFSKTIFIHHVLPCLLLICALLRMIPFEHEIDFSWTRCLLESLMIHFKLSNDTNFVPFACHLSHFPFLWSLLWNLPWLKFRMLVLPLLSQTLCHFCVNFSVRILRSICEWNLIVIHMSMLWWIFRIFRYRWLWQVAIDLPWCPAALHHF